ncbi:MAG: hypothetical protein EPO13_11105 [Actinomycetota bacterium]|nr:MAG: hypothetical protein EPO13_11105 [Actinomycetota bacterium]
MSIPDHAAAAEPAGDPGVPSHDRTLFEDPVDTPPVLDPAWETARAANGRPVPTAAAPVQSSPAIAGSSAAAASTIAGSAVPGDPATETATGPAHTARTAHPDGSAGAPGSAQPAGSVRHEEAEPVPVRAAPAVDVGRLYRSAGAAGPATTGTIPALTPEMLAARAAAATAASPPPAAVQSRPQSAGPAAVRPAGAGLNARGVAVVVTGVTLLLGLADAIIGTGRLGWVTGVGLVLSSVYAAFAVRLNDLWTAVFTPPLAYLVTVLIAGQLTLGEGTLLTREAIMIVSTLSFNAPWILAATLAALVIVLVRRRAVAAPRQAAVGTSPTTGAAGPPPA